MKQLKEGQLKELLKIAYARGFNARNEIEHPREFGKSGVLNWDIVDEKDRDEVVTELAGLV